MIPSRKVQCLSALSAFSGILFVGGVSHLFIEGPAWSILNMSLGASAILLFAAPNSEFSRPRALLGGQVLSAVIGVSCAYVFSNVFLGAAVAVAASILAMFAGRCLFPPAGACALSPVLGDDVLQTLGYQYVLTPVLLDALLILLFAAIVNRLVLHRLFVANVSQKMVAGEQGCAAEDVEKALQSLDTYVDISVQDLTEIVNKARYFSYERQWKTLKKQDSSNKTGKSL